MANIFTEIIRYLSKKFVFYGAIYYHTRNDSMPENTSLTSMNHFLSNNDKFWMDYRHKWEIR